MQRKQNEKERVEHIDEMPPHTIVEQQVLDRITPKGAPPKIIAATLAKVEHTIKEQQVLASVAMGGSLAKGTYLAGDHDIDVFVRFSNDYADAELAEHLEQILTATFGKKNIERVHGSRDYFHIQLPLAETKKTANKSATKNSAKKESVNKLTKTPLESKISPREESFLFEFIPVTHVESWSEARNVTDMSPLHVQYVAGHIAKRPWLAGEIRLTKQFCKANRVYGAESYIGGFSGHVIDLLNIHYGGFRELLTAAASWPAKVVIDPEHRLASPLTELNDAKTYSPLVIVDPIQQDRNSAAAITKHAFERFKKAAQEYCAQLTRPQNEQDATKKNKQRATRETTTRSVQEQFFIIRPLDENTFKAKHDGAEIISVTLKALQGKKDVVGAKCMKVYEYCVEQLVENHMPLLASDWEYHHGHNGANNAHSKNNANTALLLFALTPGLLPEQEELQGPPVHKTDAVRRFTAVHKTTYTRDSRHFALEPRKYRSAQKLLLHIIKSKYTADRIMSATLNIIASGEARERTPDQQQSAKKKKEKKSHRKN